MGTQEVTRKMLSLRRKKNLTFRNWVGNCLTPERRPRKRHHQKNKTIKPGGPELFRKCLLSNRSKSFTVSQNFATSGSHFEVSRPQRSPSSTVSRSLRSGKYSRPYSVSVRFKTTLAAREEALDIESAIGTTTSWWHCAPCVSPMLDTVSSTGTSSHPAVPQFYDPFHTSLSHRPPSVVSPQKFQWAMWSTPHTRQVWSAYIKSTKFVGSFGATTSKAPKPFISSKATMNTQPKTLVKNQHHQRSKQTTIKRSKTCHKTIGKAPKKPPRRHHKTIENPIPKNTSKIQILKIWMMYSTVTTTQNHPNHRTAS